MKFLDTEELPWGVLFFSTMVVFISAIFVFSFLDKTTTGYSLATESRENLGQTLFVTKEIKNYPDQSILLPDTMSYWEAARFVDSLNKTIK